MAQNSQVEANEKRGRDHVSITLDPQLRERLELIARAENRSLSGQIRHALIQVLGQHESAAA